MQISQNSTIKLNKNCEIIPKTCAETKGFTTAIVTYRVTKNTIPIYSGTEDMCAKMKSSGGDVKELLKVFQLPDHCPVEKVSFHLKTNFQLSFIDSFFASKFYGNLQNKVCASGDQKIDISKQKRMLPIAMGRLTMHVDIKHDTVSNAFLLFSIIFIFK